MGEKYPKTRHFDYSPVYNEVEIVDEPSLVDVDHR
jgi:hypothetical protein